jgi:hypothetical protein
MLAKRETKAHFSHLVLAEPASDWGKQEESDGEMRISAQENSMIFFKSLTSIFICKHLQEHTIFQNTLRNYAKQK